MVLGQRVGLPNSPMPSAGNELIPVQNEQTNRHGVAQSNTEAVCVTALWKF